MLRLMIDLAALVTPGLVRFVVEFTITLAIGIEAGLVLGSLVDDSYYEEHQS